MYRNVGEKTHQLVKVSRSIPLNLLSRFAAVDIQMSLDDGTLFSVMGVSYGGGRVGVVRVNNVPVEISGRYSTIFISHSDQADLLARVIGVVSKDSASMVSARTFREPHDGRAGTILEVDGQMGETLLTDLQKIGRIGHTRSANQAHLNIYPTYKKKGKAMNKQSQGGLIQP